MDSKQFPVFVTKVKGLNQKFDLSNVEGRKQYFEAKAGPEIKKLKTYLERNSFVAFLLGKKNSGKGTYSKMFMEIVGKDKVGHLSVGDLVRDIHRALETSEESKKSLIEFLKNNYRGYHSVEETIDLIMGRNQSSLISSELILALIKYEISKRPKQALFIDGFPRALDQVGYSLFLKQLIGYEQHPDFLVFINVPNAIIDERIKYRVVCPICKAPRNTKLMATSEIGFDETAKTFYLMCDNPSCNKARMMPKEGDELGIEPIRQRLETDDQIFTQLLKLHGVPKIFLRNSIPKAVAAESVDDYELTPEYSYKLDTKTKKIKIIEQPWTIKDDDGVESFSQLPPPVVLSLIKQMVEVLGL